MAEVHIVGQIVGASGFQQRNLFCKWGVEVGQSWDRLEGADMGQTHVDHPEEGEMAVWAHPIDLHDACKGLSGWPKIHFQVWHQDIHGRSDICGYSFCHIPSSPGMHTLDAVTWSLEGSLLERVSAFFIGGSPRLKLEEVVHTPGDRFRLQTVSGGVIHLELGIVLKDFSKYNVRYN